MTSEDKKAETARTILTGDEESKVEKEFEIAGIQDDQCDDAKGVSIPSEPTDVEDLKDNEANMTTEDKKGETTRTIFARKEESKVEQEFEIAGIQDDQYDDTKGVSIPSEPTDVEHLKDDVAVTPSAPPPPSNQPNVTETAISDDAIIGSNQNNRDGADSSGGESCGGNSCGYASIS